MTFNFIIRCSVHLVVQLYSKFYSCRVVETALENETALDDAVDIAWQVF